MEAEMRNRLAFLKSCETGNVADAFVRLGAALSSSSGGLGLKTAV